MHAFVKPKNSKDDVFIRFPTGMMALPLSDKMQWLSDHKIEYGYWCGMPVGVYLSNTDAMIFKLKFGA